MDLIARQVRRQFLQKGALAAHHLAQQFFARRGQGQQFRAPVGRVFLVFQQPLRQQRIRRGLDELAGNTAVLEKLEAPPGLVVTRFALTLEEVFIEIAAAGGAAGRVEG